MLQEDSEQAQFTLTVGTLSKQLSHSEDTKIQESEENLDKKALKTIWRQKLQSFIKSDFF